MRGRGPRPLRGHPRLSGASPCRPLSRARVDRAARRAYWTPSAPAVRRWRTARARRGFALLGLLVAVACGRRGSDAEVLEHHGKWESGYGSKFYNVVGRLKNVSDQPLVYVKLRIDAVGKDGAVVASTETYNESAEVLGVPEVDGQQLLAQGKIKTIPPGAEERFRGSFLDEETPPFDDYAVTVIEVRPVR
jgi:hypothetical protein